MCNILVLNIKPNIESLLDSGAVLLLFNKMHFTENNQSNFKTLQPSCIALHFVSPSLTMSKG